jgi:hypothetical protein
MRDRFGRLLPSRAVGLMIALGATAGCGGEQQAAKEKPDAGPSGGADAAFVQGELDGGVARVVGAEGGRLEFSEGIVLEVPPGALSGATTISAAVLRSEDMDGASERPGFVAGVRLRPSGLIFNLPVTLTMRTPADAPEQLRIVLEDDEAALHDPALEDDDPSSIPELLTVVARTVSTVSVHVPHFSAAIARTTCPSTGVELGQVRCDCATPSALGLSSQLLRIAGLPMTPVRPSGRLVVNPEANAVLDQAALSDLYAAAGEIDVRANFLWRSLATQWVISDKSCSAVKARVGRSNHGAGAAVDVGLDVTKEQANDRCALYRAKNPTADRNAIMNATLPGNLGDVMRKHNWIWWGLVAEDDAKVCKDSVHFEHRAEVLDERSGTRTYPELHGRLAANDAQAEAFRKLWNNANPCGKVDAAALPTKAGSKLYDALSKAPVAGFPVEFETTARDLPPRTGAGDAGCSQQGAVCCPASGGRQSAWCSTQGGAEPWSCPVSVDRFDCLISDDGVGFELDR